jgi:hypothetical protein
MAPPECKDVKIEGRYDSFSTLLLVRISVATWNLLPGNPAYSFVGFVTSENKACKLDHLEMSTTCREINTETPPLYDLQTNPEVKERGDLPSEAAAQLTRSRNDEKGSTTNECQATTRQSSSEWISEKANNPDLDDQRATKFDAGVGMASMDTKCAICSQPAIARCNCEVKGLDTAVRRAEQRTMANVFSDIDTHSSSLWNDNITVESQNPLLEDWVLPPPQTSVVNSPLNYSPSFESLSLRYNQDFPDLVELPPYTTGDRMVSKPIGPSHSKAKDLVAAARRQRSLLTPGTSEASDEVGRSSLEIDNTARDHPLYFNVTPKADGLYHCPWEGQGNCQHKPEKLRCNYEYATLYFPSPLSNADHTSSLLANSSTPIYSPIVARLLPVKTPVFLPPPASCVMNVKPTLCMDMATNPIFVHMRAANAALPGMVSHATGISGTT